MTRPRGRVAHIRVGRSWHSPLPPVGLGAGRYSAGGKSAPASAGRRGCSPSALGEAVPDACEHARWARGGCGCGQKQRWAEAWAGSMRSQRAGGQMRSRGAVSSRLPRGGTGPPRTKHSPVVRAAARRQSSANCCCEQFSDGQRQVQWRAQDLVR
ncbi:hypothetical protein T492DRAFT_1036981 [Pavlovales sp. CCMP2436]|nr:hypothetical protein T492DRAFT_1036981 [Pavlovales sp. CCMP2436]